MPESQTITVGRLVADQWQTYRAVRLAMLADSPAAFGSTHAAAASFDEQRWRQRLTDNAVFLARVGDSPAGSATYSEHGATDPAACALFGMWVDPGFRLRGVGQHLVRAVVSWAKDAGRGRVILHVTDDNVAARVLYEREGFVATGRRIPHPGVDLLTDVEMELVVA